MKYRAIVFDFDGTLANNLSFFVKAYDYALQKYDVHLSEDEIVLQCFGKTEEAITQQLNLPSAEEFRSHYFEGIAKFFVKVRLFPGAYQLLTSLQEKDVQLGLVSFAQEWYIQLMLNQTKIAQRFDSVVTFTDVTKPKPDPEALQLTSETLRIPLNETLAIGDSKNDILMGKAAGCTTALFLPEDNKPYYDFSELRKLEPDFVFTTYEELSQIVLPDQQKRMVN